MGALSTDREGEFEAAAVELEVIGSTRTEVNRVLHHLKSNNPAWVNLVKHKKAADLMSILQAILRKLERRRCRSRRGACFKRSIRCRTGIGCRSCRRCRSRGASVERCPTGKIN